MVLEFRHHDDVAGAEVVEPPGVRDEVGSPLGRAAGEDHLAFARRVQERGDLRARSLVARCCVLGELLDAAVHVRVGGLVEVADRVEDLSRLLRRRGGVEVRERLPVDLTVEDREVRAQLVRIQLGACLNCHRAYRTRDEQLHRDGCGGIAFEGAALDLGRGVHEGKLEPDAVVRLPLATSNRHGLIAGATGTGKTRTLQLLAEQLSEAGVSVFAADYKGDVSGLGVPGPAEGKAAERMADLGLAYEPTSYPAELLSLGGIGPGAPVRASVTDFGPQLLAKVLGSNETQESSLALVFRYADERGLAHVDLADLRALLAFLESKQGKEDLTGMRRV